MKHIALKSLLTTTMLAAGLSLSGCEKMPTPEEEADIKAEEDAIMAEDEANDDTEGPGDAVKAVAVALIRWPVTRMAMASWRRMKLEASWPNASTRSTPTKTGS